MWGQADRQFFKILLIDIKVLINWGQDVAISSVLKHYFLEGRERSWELKGKYNSQS